MVSFKSQKNSFYLEKIEDLKKKISKKLKIIKNLKIHTMIFKIMDINFNKWIKEMAFILINKQYIKLIKINFG